jgi:hypothetical protein
MINLHASATIIISKVRHDCDCVNSVGRKVLSGKDVAWLRYDVNEGVARAKLSVQGGKKKIEQGFR